MAGSEAGSSPVSPSRFAPGHFFSSPRFFLPIPQKVSLPAGYARSGPQCRSLVPIGPESLHALSEHCEDHRVACSTRGQSAGKKKDI